MSEKQKPAGYRFTEAEDKLIQDTFQDNEELMSLLSKIFLPSLDTETAQAGNVIDAAHVLDTLVFETDKMPAEEVAIRTHARNRVMTYINSRLNEIRQLANLGGKSDEEKQAKAKKDSTR